MASLNRMPTRWDKVKYPTTLEEAKFLIKQTFASRGNQWSETEQKSYFASLGIDSTLERLDREQTKIVLNDLIKSRMILIKV